MDSTDYRRMRLVSAGVKLFGRSELGTASKYTSNVRAHDGTGSENAGEGGKKEKKVEFRVLSDGLMALLPHLDVSKLIVGGQSALRVFLQTYYPLCTSFEEDFREKLEALGVSQ